MRNQTECQSTYATPGFVVSEPLRCSLPIGHEGDHTQPVSDGSGSVWVWSPCPHNERAFSATAVWCETCGADISEGDL